MKNIFHNHSAIDNQRQDNYFKGSSVVNVAVADMILWDIANQFYLISVLFGIKSPFDFSAQIMDMKFMVRS